MLQLLRRTAVRFKAEIGAGHPDLWSFERMAKEI